MKYRTGHIYIYIYRSVRDVHDPHRNTHFSILQKQYGGPCTAQQPEKSDGNVLLTTSDQNPASESPGEEVCERDDWGDLEGTSENQRNYNEITVKT